MDPAAWRTVSHIAVFLGSGLALAGGIGTYYFGNQVEKSMPFKRPLNAASATVEVTVDSGQQINAHFMDSGGYLIFAKGQDAMLTVSSQESWARQLGNNRVLYRGIFNMDANDTAAGKPVRQLAEAKYVQIFFHEIPKGKRVLSGSAVITLNSEIRFEIDIPEQVPEQVQQDAASREVDDNLILVRDLKKVLGGFKN